MVKLFRILLLGLCYLVGSPLPQVLSATAEPDLELKLKIPLGEVHTLSTLLREFSGRQEMVVNDIGSRMPQVPGWRASVFELTRPEGMRILFLDQRGDGEYVVSFYGANSDERFGETAADLHSLLEGAWPSRIANGSQTSGVRLVPKLQFELEGSAERAAELLESITRFASGYGFRKLADGGPTEWTDENMVRSVEELVHESGMRIRFLHLGKPTAFSIQFFGDDTQPQALEFASELRRLISEDWSGEIAVSEPRTGAHGGSKPRAKFELQIAPGEFMELYGILAGFAEREGFSFNETGAQMPAVRGEVFTQIELRHENGIEIVATDILKRNVFFVAVYDRRQSADFDAVVDGLQDSLRNRWPNGFVLQARE